MKVLIVTLLYGLFFIAVEIVTKKTKLSREISRKVVHIVSGTTAALLPLYMPFHDIAYVGLLFVPIMFVSKKADIFRAIHGVARSTYGEIYFPMAIFITAVAFPDRFLYMYGMFIMALSDGFASVIGQKYGKTSYKLLAAKKSYVGSITFFITAVLTGIIIMFCFSYGVAPTILISTFLAAVLAITEGSLSGGLDNLILPPLASGLMALMLVLFGLR
jgi:phytol kinase